MEQPRGHEPPYELDDPELGPGERARLQAHLADCPECRLAVGLWRRARALVAAMKEPRSAGLVRGVMARVAAEPRRPAGLLAGLREALWSPAPALGLGLAAALFALAWIRDSESVSAEALLLADAGESDAVESLVGPSAPGPDAVLGLALEIP